jgi:hypothetical protein
MIALIMPRLHPYGVGGAIASLLVVGIGGVGIQLPDVGVGGDIMSPLDALLRTFLTNRTNPSSGPCHRGSRSRGAAVSGAAMERRRTSTRDEATERERMAVALL